MISAKEALSIIISSLPPKKVIRKHLTDSLGYSLAEDIYADTDQPPFDKSAMDGFAVRFADLNKMPAELELVTTVAAGEIAGMAVAKGKTIKIMTGAPVPAGADTVVMKEMTKENDNKVVFMEKPGYKANICFRGEDVKKGRKVIAKGTLINPAIVGLLATFGKTHPRVFANPSLAVLATGSELVAINQKPKRSQIRNSNSYVLSAQLQQLGFQPDNLGIARDSQKELESKLKAGLKKDALIITGGVSTGDYDIVEPVLRKLGVKILFNAVAIKPGKPFVFGINKIGSGKCLIFALPGNPVSVFVTMHVFVKPALLKLAGVGITDGGYLKAKLSGGKLRQIGRQQYIPALLNEERNTVAPVEWHGSADLVGLAHANSLIAIPPDEIVRQGDYARIIKL